LRFHGTKKLYQGSYHGNSLRAWAKKMKNWAKQKETKAIYLYFNNDQEGSAPKDALKLKIIINSL